MFILGFIAGAVSMTVVTVVLFYRETRKSKERIEEVMRDEE